MEKNSGKIVAKSSDGKLITICTFTQSSIFDKEEDY